MSRYYSKYVAGATRVNFFCNEHLGAHIFTAVTDNEGVKLKLLT